MKKTFLKKIKYLFIGATFLLGAIVIGGWHEKNTSGNNPIPGITSIVNTSFSVVDAQVDAMVSPNKIYLRSEALDLRKNLENLHAANPDDIAVNLALVRFHACAPNYSGGFKGVAHQHASAIYRQNAYIGCLAFEYIYAVNNDFIHAEEWYKMSLACKLLEGQEWREVKSNRYYSYGLGVKGNFSNGKVQPLYENLYGTFKRIIMMPKCATEKCEFTLVPDFLRGANNNVMGKLLFAPY